MPEAPPLATDQGAAPARTPGAKGLGRELAGRLASSFLMARGRRLYEANTAHLFMPLSKVDKVLAGIYIILKDYALGLFPPTFEDQARAYEAEVTFFHNTPGVSAADWAEGYRRKPFWGPRYLEKSNRDLTSLLKLLAKLGVEPGGRVLELGCGSGWMSEFLALAGYSAHGTSLSPEEIDIANERARSFAARGLANSLRFDVAAMETLDEVVGAAPFDAAFVYEALHHAFDWRKALGATFRCLKPGGWLILANEPNLLHTFISYRFAKLTKVHDIGMSRRQLVSTLRAVGFSEVRVLRPRLNNLVSFHWIAARR